MRESSVADLKEEKEELAKFPLKMRDGGVAKVWSAHIDQMAPGNQYPGSHGAYEMSVEKPW